MTAPIIPADQWPEWADRHCWTSEGGGMFFGVERTDKDWKSEYGYSGIPLPGGWDWRVPVMRQPAPTIDLEQFRAALDHALLSIQSEEKRGEIYRLRALIDGQANVRSSSEHSEPLTPVAHKKLQGLQAEGFIVNGVAIFNPATGQRGLVDYLGYVGWQASEQPSKGEGVADVP